MRIQFQEIARELLARTNRGPLLDVGAGHSRLLRETSTVNPDIELYGLDISSAMVRRATKNLAGLKVDLRVANICSTGYEADFFDLVTCTGSFYLWSQPLAGLREVYRILVPGGSDARSRPAQDSRRSAERNATAQAGGTTFHHARREDGSATSRAEIGIGRQSVQRRLQRGEDHAGRVAHLAPHYAEQGSRTWRMIAAVPHGAPDRLISAYSKRGSMLRMRPEGGREGCWGAGPEQATMVVQRANERPRDAACWTVGRCWK
jgi:SAM-dependent methyltransferase